MTPNVKQLLNEIKGRSVDISIAIHEDETQEDIYATVKAAELKQFLKRCKNVY